MNSELVIETHGLTKHYDNVEAVLGLNLAVVSQCITGFLGRNGAGKSTTIKILLGMIRPTTGTGRVLGYDIADSAQSLEIRRRIAYVGEDKGLYGYMAHVFYPLDQMVRFSLLWCAGGMVFFAVAFLSATLFSSEYAALAASFVFMIFYPITVMFPPLNRYPLNIHHIMSGLSMPYFDARKALLAGLLPWTLFASMIGIAGVLIVLAVHITDRRDYS